MQRSFRAAATAAFFFGVVLVGRASAQTGQVLDDLSLESKILGGPRKYAVYLPPDYDTSKRRYPVLYLLHGSGDDQTGWVQFGEVLHIADKAINGGTATPMVIVMPDANTGRRGYFNSIDGKWKYEDFFFEELVPHVEKEFRIKSEKRYRAVAGLSMGGGGSFMYALHHPEMFSSACPLSASVGALSINELKERLTRDRSERKDESSPQPTEAELEAHFKRYAAIPLIEALDDGNKGAVRWYIDCGDDDFLSEGNALVHVAMMKKGVPHEFRVRDGGHTWTYWRQSLPTVLEFVSQAFHQY